MMIAMDSHPIKKCAHMCIHIKSNTIYFGEFNTPGASHKFTLLSNPGTKKGPGIMLRISNGNKLRVAGGDGVRGMG